MAFIRTPTDTCGWPPMPGDSFIRFDPETQEIVEYPLPLGSIIRDIWPDQEGRMWFISGWLRDKVGSAEIAGN